MLSAEEIKAIQTRAIRLDAKGTRLFAADVLSLIADREELLRQRNCWANNYGNILSAVANFIEKAPPRCHADDLKEAVMSTRDPWDDMLALARELAEVLVHREELRYMTTTERAALDKARTMGVLS